MRRLVCRMLLASIVFLVPSLCLADTVPGVLKFSPKVKVEVQCKNESDKSLTESYVTRELRSLGDVTLGENDPDWTIQILALPVQDKSGVTTGVDFSVIFFKTQYKNIRSYLSNQPENVRKYVELITQEVGTIEGHSILIGSEDDVKSNCEKIVASFDSQCLAPARKLNEYQQSVWRKYAEPGQNKTSPTK